MRCSTSSKRSSFVPPTVLTDGGIENFSGAVDELIHSGLLHRVLAGTEKGNQPTLHHGLIFFFADHLADDFARLKVRRHETHEHGHGRDEMRFYYVCSVPQHLPDQERWRKLRAIGLAINNTIRNGKECIEYRYYILSAFPSAQRFAEAVRSHWSIENRLHWQLDVTFQEDQSRIRKGNADANFSSLRRTALSLLKNYRTKKVGVKNKRLVAALSDDYLTEVLVGK